MTVTITAFESSPDRGEGQARDMRVRWAFEEAGRPYDIRLLSFEAMKRPAHLRFHPFGRIPTYEEDGLALFESGAIILRIGELQPGLLPAESKPRARAMTVLRRLDGCGILEGYPALAAYVARGESRPACRRAFDAQLAVFTGGAADR